MGVERMQRGSQVRTTPVGLVGTDRVPFLMLGGGFVSVHFITRFHYSHITCVLVYVFIHHILKFSRTYKLKWIS